MKLYGYVLERGEDKQFRKEVFFANKRNGVYYLEGSTPKWLCRHYVYDFEIGRAVSAVADYVFLLEDDEERAQSILVQYYLDEIQQLYKEIEKYDKKGDKVANGTV